MATETNTEALDRIEEDKELIIDGLTDKVVGVEMTLKDYAFLKSEAERAQELERKLKLSEAEKGLKTELNNAAVKIIEEKDRENSRLRKALEKIAASGLDCFENECTYIARTALAGETNGQR